MYSDPVYTVASENDHARATLEAHTSAEKLVSIECRLHLSLFSFSDGCTVDVNILQMFYLKLCDVLRMHPVQTCIWPS